jgi:hypothetical protein
MVNMNRLGSVRQAQVVRCLCEGNSIRSTVRMTGVAKNTVTKLLVGLGAACIKFQDHALQNLSCKRLQADEIWSFEFSKAKNSKPEHFENDGYSLRLMPIQN